MSRVVANLDAAIEAYQAEQEQVDRVLRLFKRDWTLLPDVSTATLNPILQVQALAEEATTDEEQSIVGLKSITAIQQVITGSVIETERPELTKQLTSIGLPLGALETIIESIMEAFSAAPLHTPEVEESATPIPEPLPASITDSGSLSIPDGPTSKEVSTVPMPPMPPAPQAPPGSRLELRQPGPVLEAIPDVEEATAAGA